MRNVSIPLATCERAQTSEEDNDGQIGFSKAVKGSGLKDTVV
jgi:hypothetical protein